MNIKTVTVLGANGTMGLNVSGIFASFGGAKVYMVCRTMEDAIKAVDRACKSVKADAIREKLIPVDYTKLEEVLALSDLVFESVAENLITKQEINKKIASSVSNSTLICTGTSGLSINVLAEVFSEKVRKNYMGVHFYNPPYNMTLCEIIPSDYTDKTVFMNIKEYLSKTLNRTVVEVKDQPAFLGNRIGFQFINEALQYAEKYKDNGGIDYMDAILGQFTGRSMAPLVTSDFVGLDVHKAIVDNIYNNTNDYARETFRMPEFALKMVEQGKLGRKSGEGLYKTVISETGKKTRLVYDISKDEYREKMKYSFPFIEDMIDYLTEGDYSNAMSILINNHSLEASICLEFLLKYVLYSLAIANLVADKIQAADDVMATGFNWIPPMAIIDAFGGAESFKEIVINRINTDILDKIDLNALLEHVEQSTYDYRRYFRAKY